MAIPRITVLTSGRGSNLRALLTAEHAGTLSGTITAVIANRPGIPALAIAAAHGVASTVVPHRNFEERGGFDLALARAIDASEPDLIVLAGFMRILGSEFVARYKGRMLNIHPSLLPAYAGLYTHRRALADGARIHGCTVHFVTDHLDHGPIVAQSAVPVAADDDEDRLAARVLEAEHRLLPTVVRWYCEGRIVIVNDRVHVKDETLPAATLDVPSLTMLGAGAATA
jgi:phosphoribosylglycinamide formyltransferase-1